MAEPKTAEALARRLKALYCRHFNGDYCEVCAADLIASFARRQVEAWRSEALRIASDDDWWNKAVDRIAARLRALPVGKTPEQ